MNILFLAPQPFYVERGTPIAVRLAVTTLCRAGHKVDLLTFHGGEDVTEPGLNHIRIAPPPWVGDIGVGFSWRKLVCDFWLGLAAHKRMTSNRYDVVHAVEESIFLVAPFRSRKTFKLVYDMDSVLSDQLAEKWAWLRPMLPLLRSVEMSALKAADLVLPVCEAIADRIAPVAAGKTRLLPDAATEPVAGSWSAPDNLRVSLQISGPIALYVGNLESYQGIDLLLQSFAHVASRCTLVIIGGRASDVEYFKGRSHDHGVSERVAFVGPRPLADLSGYLAQADVLCSPRLKGVNTPMKLYSYMASGKPIVATAIESHTQVLNCRSAMLTGASALEFGKGVERVVSDPSLARALGAEARATAQTEYSLAAFERRLTAAYAILEIGP